MALEQTYFLQALPEDSAVQYTGREMRQPADAFAYTPGVFGLGHFAVTQRGAGANQSVDFAPGLAAVAGDPATFQGKFLQRNNGIVNSSTTPAAIPNIPASGTRRHIVALHINDRQSGASIYTPEFVLIQDTGGGGGLPPVPANHLALAEIRRVAGQAEGQSVINSKIFSLRSLAGSLPAVAGHFEFWGGNGQPIPRNVTTGYEPFGVRRAPLGCTVADPTVATVTNMAGGCWALSAGLHLNGATVGARTITIKVTAPDGTNQRVIGPASLGDSAGLTPLFAAREFTVVEGSTATVFVWQNVLASTNINDDTATSGGDGVAHFTGRYCGSLPGVPVR